MPIDLTKSRHALAFIVFVVLLDAISFGIVLPVMPKLIMSLADVSLSEASKIGGYLMFAYASVQFFAAPILGNLGDKFGAPTDSTLHPGRSRCRLSAHGRGHPPSPGCLRHELLPVSLVRPSHWLTPMSRILRRRKIGPSASA